MERVYYFLNTGLCFWSLALFTWYVYASPWAAVPAALALLAFCLHGLQRRVLIMFGKSKKIVAEEPLNTITPVPATVEKVIPREEKQNNTVIASDVRFEGNVIADGQVYIYGEVHGNIDSRDGIVKIMRNGLVQGNISCRDLIVDGSLYGECQSYNVDIYEHGLISGSINYATLAIQKGGTFVGQSTSVQKEESETNVVGITAEKNVTDPYEALSSETDDELARHLTF